MAVTNVHTLKDQDPQIQPKSLPIPWNLSPNFYLEILFLKFAGENGKVAKNRIPPSLLYQFTSVCSISSHPDILISNPLYYCKSVSVHVLISNPVSVYILTSWYTTPGRRNRVTGACYSDTHRPWDQILSDNNHSSHPVCWKQAGRHGAGGSLYG